MWTSKTPSYKLPENYKLNEIDNLSTINLSPMKENLFDYVGGRKFIFAVLISIGAFGLAFAGKINFDQLFEVLTWIFGLYVGANVTQKIGIKK